MQICANMPDPPKQKTRPTDPESNGQQPSESRLKEISEQFGLPIDDDLTPLGIYSIHDGDARLITLPSAVDGFDDAPVVMQYCYEDDNHPLLIIAPVTI